MDCLLKDCLFEIMIKLDLASQGRLISVNKNLSIAFTKEHRWNFNYGQLALDILTEKRVSKIDTIYKFYHLDPRTTTELKNFCDQYKEDQKKDLNCYSFIISKFLHPIPLTLCLLTKLSFLEINKTKVLHSDISSIINSLPRLVSLYLIDTELETLPSSIKDLNCLENLCLNNNNFTEIPEDVCSLKILCTLIIENNKINYITKNLKNLEKLIHLNLNTNIITSLPIEVMQIKTLTQLCLANNLITEFPVDIQKCNFIPGYIKLDNNQITKLPFNIFHCGSNFTLTLNNNPLTFTKSDLLNYELNNITITDIKLSSKKFIIYYKIKLFNKATNIITINYLSVNHSRFENGFWNNPIINHITNISIIKPIQKFNNCFYNMFSFVKSFWYPVERYN